MVSVDPAPIRNRANVCPATVCGAMPDQVRVNDDPSGVPVGTTTDAPSVASKTPLRLKSTQPTRVAGSPDSLFDARTDTEYEPVTPAMISPNAETAVSSSMVWFGAVPPTTLSPVAEAFDCIDVSASADQPR